MFSHDHHKSYHIRLSFSFQGETLTGCGNEHVAFLRLRALELQGEVQEAFIHAIVFEALNPEVNFLFINFT